MNLKGLVSEGEFLTDEQAMALALDQARLGGPYVSPNPLVGCVILDEHNRFLASGYHTKYGFPHAEVEAYKKLSADQLKNAQFFVTLEPCAHEGKTPSCAKALAQFPLKKVVYGLVDPNPLVSGQGAEIIQKAGIQCSEYQGPLKKELYEVCEIFLKNFNSKKVFVSLKVAQSLDGVIALKSGESQWITSSESREFVHELRALHDAVLVGRKTVEIDNPSLNIRHPLIKKTNKVVIIDTQGELLAKISQGVQFKFLKIHSPENIFIFASKLAIEKFKQSLKLSGQNNDKMAYLRSIHLQVWSSTENMLNQLFELGIKSVFVEGGASTYGHLIKANCVDRLHIFTAPVIIGQGNGLSWTQLLETNQLDKKIVLHNVQNHFYGIDHYTTGKILFTSGS